MRQVFLLSDGLRIHGRASGWWKGLCSD